MSELMVGFSRRDITPPSGVPNALGFSCLCKEIWDPLYVTVALLRHGAEYAVIIGTDLNEGEPEKSSNKLKSLRKADYLGTFVGR